MKIFMVFVLSFSEHIAMWVCRIPRQFDAPNALKQTPSMTSQPRSDIDTTADMLSISTV